MQGFIFKHFLSLLVPQAPRPHVRVFLLLAPSPASASSFPQPLFLQPLLLIGRTLLCSKRGGPLNKGIRRSLIFSPEEKVSGPSKQPITILTRPQCDSLEALQTRLPLCPPQATMLAMVALCLVFGRGQQIFPDLKSRLTCSVSLCSDPLLERTGNKD